MEKIKDYIEKLENQSFEGWTEEAIRGYKTACISIKEQAELLEEKKEFTHYEIIELSKKVNVMYVPGGKIYMIETDGNGTGKRPLHVPNEFNIEGMADKFLPEVEKFFIEARKIFDKHREANSIKEDKEELEVDDISKEPIPLQAIAYRSRAFLDRLKPELIAFISEKLKEDDLKYEDEDPIETPEPPKTKTTTKKTTKK